VHRGVHHPCHHHFQSFPPFHHHILLVFAAEWSFCRVNREVKGMMSSRLLVIFLDEVSGNRGLVVAVWRVRLVLQARDLASRHLSDWLIGCLTARGVKTPSESGGRCDRVFGIDLVDFEGLKDYKGSSMVSFWVTRGKSKMSDIFVWL
jgi:hypothetical protein